MNTVKNILILIFGILLLFQAKANEKIEINSEEQKALTDKYPKGSFDGIDFSVTIIGSGNPQYNPERSGPSALVQFNGTKFLVDMGNGTRAQLEKLGFTRRNSPDALLLTHHHIDHNEEFIPMVHQKLMLPGDFLVAGPAPIKEMTDYVAKFYKEDLDYRKSNKGQGGNANSARAIVKELEGDTTFAYKGVTISTTEVPHSIYTLAYRFDANGKSIVISGDLSYTPNLPKLAKGADVLVLDCQIIRMGANKKRPGNRKKPGTAHMPVWKKGLEWPPKLG